MNKHEFIETAFEAQRDAGMFETFKENFEHAEDALSGIPLRKVDPVACFLAALIRMDDEPKSAAASADYYLGELSRAVEALSKEVNA